jgi:hypothetical protein
MQNRWHHNWNTPVATGVIAAGVFGFGGWVVGHNQPPPPVVTVVTGAPHGSPQSPQNNPSAPSSQPLNFSAPNNYPSIAWLPYAISSVWNSPINPEFKVDPASATYQEFYTKTFPSFSNMGFGLINRSQDFDHPMYFGRKDDPTYSVKCTATWANCDFGNRKFHIPSFATPAGGSDAHLAVLDQTTNLELDMWGTQKLSGTGGTVTASSAGYGPITGPGLVFGTTGAGYALGAGVIRNQEIVAGKINHALFITAPCTNNNTPVFPSNWRSTDTQCANNQGAPYGERFRLNMTDEEIAKLNAPAWKKPIYYALSRYGGYIGDTNGGYAMGIQIESDEMYTSAKYKNKDCPTNGAPCTPLTAMMNTMGNPGWNGKDYIITLNEVDWAKYGSWLLPPAH